MRVLHVIPSIERRTGGPAHNLVEYANALAAAGLSVHIATRRSAVEEMQWFHSKAPGAEVIAFGARGELGLSRSPALLRWLRRAARQFDVIHVWGLFNLISSPAARVARERGAAAVITPLGTLSRYSFSYRRARLKKLYFRLVDQPNLCGVSGIHFESEAERDEAGRIDLRLHGRSWVIPPPFTMPPVEPRCVHQRARRVLFLSRLHPKKNLELLLDAWPEVTRAWPDAELVIAGDGDPVYEQSLREYARRAVGESGGVSFLGFVKQDEKAAVFASSDVFVLPSLHENFGVAVMEATAYGVPVVISPDVQLSPFVERNGLGVVVPREREALASAVLRVLADDGLRERCARNGPAAVADEFSPLAIGRQIAGMYAEAIQRGAAQAG